MLSFLKVEQVVAGLGLIGLGVLWTLGNLDRIDLLHALRIFFPALLVVWGVLELIVSFSRRAS